MSDNDISVSGFIPSDGDTTTSHFTDIETIPTKGFNLIAKAKRYGRWWILKGLKEPQRTDSAYLTLLRKEFDILIMMQHPQTVREQVFFYLYHASAILLQNLHRDYLYILFRAVGRVGCNCLYFLYDVHAFCDVPECRILSVEVGAVLMYDKELRRSTVVILSTRHRYNTAFMGYIVFYAVR